MNNKKHQSRCSGRDSIFGTQWETAGGVVKKRDKINLRKKVPQHDFFFWFVKFHSSSFVCQMAIQEIQAARRIDLVHLCSARTWTIFGDFRVGWSYMALPPICISTISWVQLSFVSRRCCWNGIFRNDYSSSSSSQMNSDIVGSCCSVP